MAIITARDYTTTTGATITSVNRGPEFIPDYIGGKTGYDDATGYCLIEIGQRGDAQLGLGHDRWRGAGSLVSGSRGSAGLRFRGEVGANRGGSAGRRRTGLCAAGATGPGASRRADDQQLRRPATSLPASRRVPGPYWSRGRPVRWRRPMTTGIAHSTTG